MPIAAVALAISYLTVSIAYMLSRAFHLPRMEAWARMEYRELIVSVILIAGVAFGITLVNAANAQFSGGADIFQSSYEYLDRSAEEMMGVYEKLLIADRYVAKMASFYYNIAVPLFLATATFSQSPRGGISVLSMMIAVGLDTLSAGVFLQMSQKVLLQFFEENSFRWLLPLGIVLRTFGFTRKLGATLMAIAIGTYAVYPLSLLFAEKVYSQLSAPVEIKMPPEPPDLQDTMICNPFVQNFMQLGSIAWWLNPAGPCVPECTGSTFGFWACMLACFPTAQFSYSAINSIFLLAAAPALLQYASMSLDDVFEPIRDAALPAVAQNAMLTAVLAVFSIILTISSTRALSAQLGGDTQFYGIYKLI